MLISIELVIVFVVLLVAAGRILSEVNSAAGLREQQIGAALLVACGTMAVYFHHEYLPYGLLRVFSVGLIVPWLLYRVLYRRKAHIIWDKVDFLFHLLALVIAASIAVSAAHHMIITPGQIAGIVALYSVSWLLLFPL